jgi:hypothetical protein
VQGVVKPREIVSVFGKCHIKLSPEQRTIMETQKIDDDVVEPEEEYAVTTPVVAAPKVVQEPAKPQTHVEDSDDESEQVSNTETPAPVVASEPDKEATEEAKPTVKKVVKKAAPSAATEEASTEETKPAAKKVVKKKTT